MDFEELVSDFASRHGVDGLSIKDGAAAVDVDGIPVGISEAGGDIVATAVVGEPPVEGRAAFAEMLLEANIGSSAFFAKLPDGGRYVVSRRFSAATTDGATFDAELEGLVNTAEAWRRILEDFRPAAEAAAGEEAAAGDAGGFGPFLQV